MQAWDDALAELRDEYVREAPGKVDALRECLDRGRAAPHLRTTVDDVRRLFHGFSGSGSTYGFPRVSELGRRGEESCVGLLESGRPLSLSDLDAWRQIVSQLEAEFSRASASPDTSDPCGRVTVKPVSAPDVLVVDDDPNITRLLANLLSLEGYSVRVASSFDEARTALVHSLPDGAVVDILLPDGTGFELVRHLRALPGGESPAVVVASVRADFLDRVEAIHCGADAYFEKPVDWQVMLEKFELLLAERRVEAGRVLSVEDDSHQASFLKSVLESAGYQVRICPDPRGFEAALSAFKPDLVLMDVMLPGMSGYDLVRYIRQKEEHATLPVLVLTTEGQLDARIRATRAGADDYLTKPVTPGLLLTAVTARVERARFLKGLIDRDGLTRLLTHTALIERARTVVARHRRRPTSSVALAMLDVDHFKSVNDRYGHPTGDRVLVSLANHLRRHLRQTDIVGRYGGEEFAVLLEDLAEEQAIRLLNRLREEFATMTHRAHDGTVFGVTFSGGIAMLPDGEPNVDDWRKAADDALYRAKHAGRNQIATEEKGPAWSHAR